MTEDRLEFLKSITLQLAKWGENSLCKAVMWCEYDSSVKRMKLTTYSGDVLEMQVTEDSLKDDYELLREDFSYGFVPKRTVVDSTYYIPKGLVLRKYNEWEARQKQMKERLSKR